MADTGPADTIRFHCPAEAVLPLRGEARVPHSIVRLLPLGEELLFTAQGGGLYRFEGPDKSPTLLVAEGKDYDLRDGAIVRLDAESITLYRGRRGMVPRALRSFPARGHDFSVAIGPRSLFLHSPGNPADVLVVERDRETGREIAAFLPVDRNLLHLLLRDLDRVLGEAGIVRAVERGFVFARLVRDPIEVFIGPRRLRVFLAGGDRGEIQTVSRALRSEKPRCPGCGPRREIETRQEVRRLYLDIAWSAGALWILRLDPPGTGRHVLHWVALDARSATAQAWSVAWEGESARALAIWRGRIVVGGNGRLGFYDLPAATEGSPCRAIALRDLAARRRGGLR